MRPERIIVRPIVLSAAVLAASALGCGTVVPEVEGAEPRDPETGALYASCQQIKTQVPDAGTGTYKVARGDATVSVFCDMGLDGGGWTAFFVGRVGSRNVFGHFETTSDDCASPRTQCLRRLPAGLTAPPEIAIRCGEAALKLTPSPAAFTYFRDGRQAGWQPAARIVDLGSADPALAASLYTGSSGNPGWIVSANDGNAQPTPRTFASSYDRNDDWDYCNGTPDTSSAVEMFYR